MGLALINGSRRILAGSYVPPVVPVGPIPADGFLVTTKREGSTGEVRIGGGVLMAPGEVLADGSTISVWDWDTGVEVSAMVVPLRMKHVDGTPMSFYIGIDSSASTGKQYLVRKNTVPVAARIPVAARPRKPASYLMDDPVRACSKLAAPYGLTPYADLTGAFKQFADEYIAWQRGDDMKYPQYRDGLITRFAQYERAHSLCCMALMTGDADFLKYAHLIMDSGSTAGKRWLEALSTGNIGLIAFEYSLDMIDVVLPYLLGGCDDYIDALITGTKQLHGLSRLGKRFSGTAKTGGSGWERAAARAIHAVQICEWAGLSFNATTLPQAGDETDGHLVNATVLPAHIDRMLTRGNVATGQSFDTALREAGVIDRATDTTKMRMEALEQEDVAANANAPITIPAQDLTIPAGCTMVADGTRRMVHVVISWDGTNVVMTPGTVRYNEVAVNSGSQPWRSIGGVTVLPATPALHRHLGHGVIWAEPGIDYIAGTTPLPPNKSTLDGITAWFFTETKNWGQKSYMMGGFMTAMITFAERFPASPHAATILTLVENICTDQWNNNWLSDAAAKHFTYVSVNAVHNGWTPNQVQGSRAPDKKWRCTNGLLSLPFAWLYKKTGNGVWLSRFAEAIAGAELNEADSQVNWSTPGRFDQGIMSDNSPNHMSGDQKNAYLMHAIHHILTAGI